MAGLSAALELRRRGHAVTVLEPGPIPHPLAASTDISKVVRMEYGADELYMELMEQAREGWLAWNRAWAGEGREPLYHETGVLMVCRAPMAAGGFEHESWLRLLARRHEPERLSAAMLRRRFPAWGTGRYVDGFFHAQGGYAESGRVVTELARWARGAGVTLLEGRRAERLSERTVGVVDDRGALHAADAVVVAAGAWTSKLVPELERAIVPTGHPVFHLRPIDAGAFSPEVFPTFTADVSQTGYYGFPIGRAGVVKIANHGLGSPADPDAPPRVGERDVERLRTFLEETFPSLANAEIVFSRVCLYDDTENEDFWIDRLAGRAGVIVAAGGSGHSFKFAPVLGSWVADVMEGRAAPWMARFARRPVRGSHEGREAARARTPE